jgi:hypothetical protein
LSLNFILFFFPPSVFLFDESSVEGERAGYILVGFFFYVVRRYVWMFAAATMIAVEKEGRLGGKGGGRKGG